MVLRPRLQCCRAGGAHYVTLHYHCLQSYIQLKCDEAIVRPYMVFLCQLNIDSCSGCKVHEHEHRHNRKSQSEIALLPRSVLHCGAQGICLGFLAQTTGNINVQIENVLCTCAYVMRQLSSWRPLASKYCMFYCIATMGAVEDGFKGVPWMGTFPPRPLHVLTLPSLQVRWGEHFWEFNSVSKKKRRLYLDVIGPVCFSLAVLSDSKKLDGHDGSNP